MNTKSERRGALAARRPSWAPLALGLALASVLAMAAHGQSLPSSPPGGGVNRGVAPLSGGSTPAPSGGIAPPAASGVVTPPPLVDPGMRVAPPASHATMPVIHPQSVQPNGTVVVPK